MELALLEDQVIKVAPVVDLVRRCRLVIQIALVVLAVQMLALEAAAELPELLVAVLVEQGLVVRVAVVAEQIALLPQGLAVQGANQAEVVAVAVPQQTVALIPVLAGLVVKVSFASIHGR